MWAHLHAYAQWLKLEEVDRDRLIWIAQPTLGADGQVAVMPFWSSPSGWRVTPTATYRLTTRYDNPTGQPIDAMGVVLAFVSPDQGSGG